MDPMATFFEAAGAFCDIAACVDPPRLDDPGTDEWTIRELVAHAARGMTTVVTALAAPVDPSTRLLDGAADYFATAMSSPGIHRGIVQRARDAAGEVGQDPGGYAWGILDELRPLLEAQYEDTVVQHAAGRIVLSEYLRTRVLELTLHSVDIEHALGSPIGFPEGPSVMTRDLVLSLVGRVDPLAVALALSGRGAMLGCNLLA